MNTGDTNVQDLLRNAKSKGAFRVNKLKQSIKEN